MEFETVSEGSFIQLPVHKDCQLRDFIDEHPDVKEYKDLTEFYFEFTSKAEFISEDKGVILMNKVCYMLLCSIHEFIYCAVCTTQLEHISANCPEISGTVPNWRPCP